MILRRRLLIDCICLSLLPIACGRASLPTPKTVAQSRGAYRDVPYPPPAALVEVVPPRPPGDSVWLDGHWVWRAGRYAWERGGWVRPPPGARLAEWDLVYLPDGTLRFAPDVWHAESGQPIASPRIIAPANPPPAQVTGEHSAPP